MRGPQADTGRQSPALKKDDTVRHGFVQELGTVPHVLRNPKHASDLESYLSIRIHIDMYFHR